MADEPKIVTVPRTNVFLILAKRAASFIWAVVCAIIAAYSSLARYR